MESPLRVLGFHLTEHLKSSRSAFDKPFYLIYLFGFSSEKNVQKVCLTTAGYDWMSVQVASNVPNCFFTRKGNFIVCSDS